MIAALALAACVDPTGAPPEAPTSECPAVPVAAGIVHVGEVVCADQRMSGGAGVNRDLWLANSRFRAVLRHPNAALSLPGVGGGTLIDAAPWGRADELLEAVPLVEGGWLDVDELSWEDDGVTLAGRVASLPYAPTAAEGARASVRWRVAPDDAWLRFEGATGLWLHPDDDLPLLDGAFVGERVAYGHDGRVVEDYGGALRLEGASGVVITTPEELQGWRPGPSRRLTGSATGGTEVRLYRGEAWVGRAAIVDGAFDALIPADVDAVRVHGAGRAPSDPAAPGEGLTLTAGPAGSVDLRLGWDGPGRPVGVRWTSPDGRAGDLLLPPAGGRFAPGAGRYTLQLDAGPAWMPRRLDVEIEVDSILELPVRLERRFDPGPRILADLAWRGHGDRSVRDHPSDRLRAALLEGLGHVVVTADDAVAGASAWVDDAPWLTFDTGATLRPSGSGTIGAWPWSRNPDRPAWGAPDVARRGPLDALALAWGGVTTNRYLAVDLAWLDAARLDPWATDPRPTHVHLPPPGAPPFDGWQPWFTWLDAGRFLLPVGPRQWLDVEDPVRWGAAELGRALHLGRAVATTGALLIIDVDGAGPGGVIPRPPPVPPDTSDTGGAAPAPLPTVHLTLHRGGKPLDELAVVVGGAGVVHSWPVSAERTEVELAVDVPLWVIGVAWSSATGDWVVTSPVWTSPPWGAGDLLPF